jgi:hypothetical protein
MPVISSNQYLFLILTGTLRGNETNTTHRSNTSNIQKKIWKIQGILLWMYRYIFVDLSILVMNYV